MSVRYIAIFLVRNPHLTFIGMELVWRHVQVPYGNRHKAAEHMQENSVSLDVQGLRRIYIGMELVERLVIILSKVIPTEENYSVNNPVMMRESFIMKIQRHVKQCV